MDINAGLSQVLAAESDTYLYGLDRIGETGASGWAYHLPDALGSVRQLTDPGAGLTATQSYDPFGSVLSAHGDGASAYGFAGEWEDDTGLIHLRARYYSPEMGRFFQVDPWEGIFEQPGTLNPYTYALNNPVLHTDPSGYAPICSWQVVSVNNETCFIEIKIGIVIRVPIPCSWKQWWEGGRRDQNETEKKATPTPKPTPEVAVSLSIFYHGTTLPNAFKMRDQFHKGGFTLPDPSQVVWGFSGEFGKGLYTTATIYEASFWAKQAALKKGGNAVVVGIEVRNYENMKGFWLKTQDEFARAASGLYDIGYDYLHGPVVAAPQLGNQIKFNVQSFPQLGWGGIVLYLP